MKFSVFVCLVVLCAAPKLRCQNADLKALAQEDQAFRRGAKIERSDEDRIDLVLHLLAKGADQTAEDKFNAALVLQHTPLDFCEKRLVSKSADNYLLAHYLAEQSFAAGYQPARILVAQTIDRYLSFTVGRQKYGTNRVINQETGKEELVPIDRSTTDAERAKYGVPSLKELLKRYPEQHAEQPNKPQDASH